MESQQENNQVITSKKNPVISQKTALFILLLVTSNIYLSSISNWFMEVLILDLLITICGYKLFDRITLHPHSIKRKLETTTLKKDIKKVSYALIIIQAIKLTTIFLLEYLK